MVESFSTDVNGIGLVRTANIDPILIHPVQATIDVARRRTFNVIVMLCVDYHSLIKPV